MCTYSALPSVRDEYSSKELCESKFVVEVYLLHSNELIARCPLSIVKQRSRYFNGLVNFKASDNDGDDTEQVEGDDFSVCETICKAHTGKTHTFTAYRFFIDEREKDRISLLATIFFFRTLCSKPEHMRLDQLNMIYNAHLHLYHIAVYYQYDNLIDKLVKQLRSNISGLTSFMCNGHMYERFIDLNRSGLVAFDVQSARRYLMNNSTDAKMRDIVDSCYLIIPRLNECDAHRLRRMAALSSTFASGISLFASYNQAKNEFVVENFHHLELGGLIGWDFGGECGAFY